MRTKRAFTLIEVLIVIVVIGILAGVMVFASDETMLSAKANNIVSNMRIIKTAALEWLADHGDFVDPYSYEVTYPYPYTTTNPSDFRNHIVKNIQNLMEPNNKVQGRGSMTKYIEILNKISINEDKSGQAYATQGGYAIVDGIVPKEPTGISKWFVVYRLTAEELNDKNQKMKRKLAALAKTHKLVQTATEAPYNGTYNNGQFVYMKIIDFAEK